MHNNARMLKAKYRQFPKNKFISSSLLFLKEDENINLKKVYFNVNTTTANGRRIHKIVLKK